MEISAHTILNTEFGPFNMAVFVDTKAREHVALGMGNISTDEPVLTRIQSECITGEVFHSVHCECRQQLDAAMKTISASGRGLLIYLRQEGRDIGLTNKIKAYELQRQGLDTIEANLQLGFPADARHYGVAQEILQELGVKKIKLLTNNPDKIAQLEDLGIEITERIPLEIAPNGFDNNYLQVKKDKMGHLLTQI
jgi:3,4-dihydroxy 2-butanone 4-phosphate synthase/GTP cyclohydrolase II